MRCNYYYFGIYMSLAYILWHQRRRGWVGRGARALVASEIQKIFGNFKTLYQLRMCVTTSRYLNVNVRQKNIKLCPPHWVPTRDAPVWHIYILHQNPLFRRWAVTGKSFLNQIHISGLLLIARDSLDSS